jgi:hypothetical protein
MRAIPAKSNVADLKIDRAIRPAYRPLNLKCDERGRSQSVASLQRGIYFVNRLSSGSL